MKRIIVSAVLACSFFTASAQNKIGYINTDELIGVMPEAEKADAELKEYQTSLQQQGQDLMKDLNEKDSLFVRDSAKLSPSMKEIKKNELVSLYQRAQSWNQQAQDMYQAEAQKKIAPLRSKALDAFRAVAKDNGYSYILDVSSVIVGHPGDDVLALVKKKMGIKDTPAPAGTTIPKKG
jgi:outer membrane protein